MAWWHGDIQFIQLPLPFMGHPGCGYLEPARGRELRPTSCSSAAISCAWPMRGTLMVCFGFMIYDSRFWKNEHAGFMICMISNRMFHCLIYKLVVISYKIYNLMTLSHPTRDRDEPHTASTLQQEVHFRLQRFGREAPLVQWEPQEKPWVLFGTWSMLPSRMTGCHD